MNNYTPKHNFRFDNAIWKIHPNINNTKFIVETRDASKRQINLFLLDFEANTIMKLPQFEILQNWWCKLEFFAGESLVFSENLDPNNPKPSVVHFVNINEEKSKLVLLDVNLGNSYSNGLELVTKNNQILSYTFEGIVVDKPTWVVAGSKLQNGSICSVHNPIFQEFVTFLQVNQLPAPHLFLEFHETDAILILSYPYLLDKELKYSFLIFNNDGQLKHKEHILKNTKGIIESSFFILQKTVLFLNSDFQITGYEIE